MSGNGRVLGVDNTPTISAASGVWGLSDVYTNSTKGYNGLWPKIIPSLTSGLTPSANYAAASTWTTDWGNSTRGSSYDVWECRLFWFDTPVDGMISESGATTTGFWIGIRDSGTVLRFRGGDGGSSKTGSDTNTAVLDITNFPKDGNFHTLTWQWTFADGTINVWIDSVLVGTNGTTDSSSFNGGSYSGTDSGSYLYTGGSIVVGESSTKTTSVTDDGNGLTIYENQSIL